MPTCFMTSARNSSAVASFRIRSGLFGSPASLTAKVLAYAQCRLSLGTAMRRREFRRLSYHWRRLGACRARAAAVKEQERSDCSILRIDLEHIRWRITKKVSDVCLWTCHSFFGYLPTKITARPAATS